MHTSYTISFEAPDTLHIHIAGELSSGAAAALRQEVDQHAAAITGPFCVLVDLSAALPMVPGARLEIVSMWRHRRLHAGALYGASRVMRTLEGVAVKAAGVADRVRFFTDLASARAWLDQHATTAG